MLQKSFRLMLALFALFGLIIISSCGGGGGGGGSSITSSSNTSSNHGITIFRQTVTMQDTDTSEYFPGQPNIWDISDDFSLSDGGDDQFDGALVLSIGSSFPSQTYSDLNFSAPAFDSTDGVKVAAVVDGVTGNINNNGDYPAIEGLNSAYLNDVYDGRVSQSVDLAGAVSPVTLSWSWEANVSSGAFAMPGTYLRAVIRSATDGSLLETLASVSSSESASYGPINLDAYINQTIILSFEIRSSGTGPNLIDAITITDGAATPYITNGDFETGDLTGWTVNEPAEYQNFTSSTELIAGLTVIRSFYTAPDKLWGRWVDTFTNNTGAQITETVTYATTLGSEGYGILYETPGTAGMALTGWDGTADAGLDPTGFSNDRDFALVFGDVDPANLTYTSASALDTADGSGDITHEYDIIVDPGDTVTIVNFIVMNGVDTNDTALDATATADVIDAAALDIVDNFWNDDQYRAGMTQAQINTVINFF